MIFGVRFKERLQAGGTLGGAVLNELQHLVAAWTTWAEVQHDEDGGHKAITAHSLTLRRDAQSGATGVVDADGTDDHTIGGPLTIDEVIEIGAAISGGPGTGASGPGISIDGTANQSTKWAIIVSDDAYADSLGIYDATAGREILKLYRGVGPVYSLCPSEDGINAIKLGDHTDLNLEFSELAGNDVYARAGYYERSRTTRMGEWAAYTPATTNLTLGNGSLSASYSRVGKTVHYEILLQFGSTTAVAGTIILGLPAASQVLATAHGVGQINAYDSSTLLHYSGKATVVGASTFAMYTHGAPNAIVNATAPFTWATGDQLWVSGTYQEA